MNIVVQRIKKTLYGVQDTTDKNISNPQQWDLKKCTRLTDKPPRIERSL